MEENAKQKGRTETKIKRNEKDYKENMYYTKVIIRRSEGINRGKWKQN